MLEVLLFGVVCGFDVVYEVVVGICVDVVEIVYVLVFLW